MTNNSTSEPTTSYVFLEGGVVQNDPGIPVIDLDVLDNNPADPDAAAEALAFRELAVSLRGARAESRAVS